MDMSEKMSVPRALVDFINRYSIIAILGHKEPDGDCIGSSLALSFFLKRLGKTPILLSDGPFKRTEITQYAPLFSTKIPKEYKNRDDVAALVVDCSSIERVGSIQYEIEGMEVAFIDHHATNNESSPIAFIDGSAPAAACLVQDLIENMTGNVEKDEAYFLLFGICTDTGFFRHLDENSEHTFSRVSRLVAKGVSPKIIFAQMNGNKSFASRLLMGETLSRLKLYYNGSLAISWQTQEDFIKYGLEGRDTDTTYMLLQAIKGVEAIVLVKEEDDGCSIGFRSLDRVDVSIIAKQFGGGGHKLASGAYVMGSYKDLIGKIVEAFKAQMERK